MAGRRKPHSEPVFAELQKKGLTIPTQIDSTTHDGEAYVTNNWGLTISELTLRHRRSNNPARQEQKTWTLLAPGDRTSDPLNFTYETGAFSPFDYWWVSFVTIAGATYTCKSSFYCSVAAEDTGIVQVALNLDDQTMTIAFSDSSGCYVGLSNV